MKIYLVGGAVRDKLLGLPIKERDWVVVGATAEDMLKLGYRQVGKEFPVFLHPKTNEEYALARMERKVQPGYKGFTFDTSPQVNLEADLIRRDLTINAMAEDEHGNLIDPYHGKKDLEQKILRHVSPAFSEDPVRILRVGRFLARYAHLGFTVAPETIELMHNMVNAGEVDALVAERVWKELERALGENHPEKFFEVLADCGALAKLFPGMPVDGPGMSALNTAARLSHDTAVRFSALLALTYPEDTLHNHQSRLVVEEMICNRYRVPNEYRELTKITIKHYKNALHAQHSSAQELLSLFNALDIYRREDRFNRFLIVCQAISLSQEMDFNSEWLRTCARVAKSVNVQELLSQGYKGNELAAKLMEKRLERISTWMSA